MRNYRFKHAWFRFRAWLGRPRMVVQTRPVLLLEKDHCVDPIFVIGVHRSGTSLVRRILNSHSRIACPPETYFLTHVAAMVRDETTFAGFEGLGFSKDQVTKEVGVWAARFHEAYRRAQGKPRWADKTPSYIGILPEIESMFGPGSRYVLVFRHPLDSLYSQWKRGWRFGSHDDPDLLVNNARYVAESIEKILAFKARHLDRCHVLHYERLVMDPEGELKDLFAFLGEPWEEGVLRYHEKPHGFGTEDPIVRGTRGFIPNSENWRALSQEELGKVLPILKETMARLGYGLDGAFPRRPR